MNNDIIWQTKIAARIHDPAEKALVLLRDPAGHENGTSRALTRLLGLDAISSDTIAPDSDQSLSRVLFKKGLPRDIYRIVQRADWWAAAADRPQWPMEKITGEEKTLAVASWAQVRWAQNPVLVHPLTGEQYSLPGGLAETYFADIKQRSLDHFSELLVKLGARDDASPDLRKILMTFWRFGPELTEEDDFGKLGPLWKLLPADTRVPDHSIWDHLDLVSAFAGAFAGDPKNEAALLTLSIGPVQGFIAAARTTSDLWAGSHLLSRLTWEVMRPVCEALGPDAILFPRLRGIPQVDIWLRDKMELPADLFKACDWMKNGTDANPLFSAAMPNRFVAVVPASRAKELAEEASKRVRSWLDDLGKKVVDRLLQEAGMQSEGEQHCHRQMREQLEGFPEVHWAVTPFSLVKVAKPDKQTGLDVTDLAATMAPFFGADKGDACGFLSTPAWQVLGKDMTWGDGTTFFAPNPGVLYPAVHELVERALAAAKAVRPFDQTCQKGWRCSLTGESEWLTTDENQLAIPPGKRKSRKDKKFREGEHHETLWTKIADKRPAWARKGEHLGALPAIKRLWPTLFAEEVEKATGRREIGRFVVSTHTMALASQLDRWLEHGGLTADGFSAACATAETVALPRRLMLRHANNSALANAKRIPGLLDAAKEAEDDERYHHAQKLVRDTLARGQGEEKEIRLETYYALIMMDGDHMGRILSGDEKTAIPYRESFHPQVQQGFDKHADRQKVIQVYGNQKRPVSPNRHLAISGALNDFSQTVVRHVVEVEHLGRLIYSGGDDVLAMLPVADLLPTMQRLRHAYSGEDPEHEGGRHHGLTLHSGFAALSVGEGKNLRLKSLMRMMGESAKASCGAVIAHHQAPLAAVMRELRNAEKRAKASRKDGGGGRNSFSLTVIKRSGGALHLTEQWDATPLLAELRNFLAASGVSRRAVYHSLEWLADLPDPKDSPDMLATLLSYQFARQVSEKDKEKKTALKSKAGDLAQRLANRTADQSKDGLKWLENFLTVAEFLARETRTGGDA